MLGHMTKECIDATRVESWCDDLAKPWRILCPININLSCTSDVIRVWPGVNKYVDGVVVSDNFSAIRESAASVSAYLWVTDKGVGSINKEAFQKELATFNCESQHAEKYDGPLNEVLHKGCECTLHKKFISIIQEMKIMRYKVIICVGAGFSQTFERKKFCKTNLTSCVGKQLFMKKTLALQFMSLWLCRTPYIAGRCFHTQLRRINNILGLIADLTA